jgi:hypothetical protein
MWRALVVAAVVAVVAAAGARANGDPASDVLITQQVFIGFEVPISTSDQEELQKTVAAANERGFTIRVALIAFSGDLGTAVSLWRRPQSYSKFLGSELAFAYANRLLIAMPSGFGFYNRRKPVAKELRVLARVPVGKTPTALARSTTAAVRALAAADGVTLPKYSSGGSEWRDRLIIAAAGVLILLIIFVPGRWLRRGRFAEARKGTPEPGKGAPEPD